MSSVSIDSRETADRKRKLSLLLPCVIEERNYGDYGFQTKHGLAVAIEYKTTEDFLNSLYSGRLASELGKMRQADVRILLVQGSFAALSSRFDLLAVQNELLSIKCSGVVVERETGLEDKAIRRIVEIYNYFQKDHHWSLVPKEDRDLGLLASLTWIHGIGEDVALNLLRRFKSPLSVAEASLTQLQEVSGIGLVRASAVYAQWRKEWKEQ